MEKNTPDIQIYLYLQTTEKTGKTISYVDQPCSGSAGYHSVNCIMYLSSVWRTDPFYIFFPYYLPLADAAHRRYDQL